MGIVERATARRADLVKKSGYKMIHWSKYNYEILKHISYKKRAGRGSNKSYNDVIIMGDTETSKKIAGSECENHVVAWTISLRSFGFNIVTLYGHRPDTMINCISKLMTSMQGEQTFLYFHNLSYDYVFLRKFFFKSYGFPVKQLNTKSHYPIYIEFENGLILRDSLILSQRNLEKWAKDMEVEHQKAVGFWDYNRIRNQHEDFTPEELTYIENDTLAGVECIDQTLMLLHKSIYSIPYTATGIPREEVRKLGAENNAHDRFVNMALEFHEFQMMENVYHGGYTHANRHFIEQTITDPVSCYDFASSYPFVMLSEKFPIEKFKPVHNCTIKYILDSSDDYAFAFCLIMINPRLKVNFTPMPALQYSKCTKIINPILDNGRVLKAAYAEIYITEQDLKVIYEQYKFDTYICTEVICAAKDYLPRWFTDYVFKLFKDKTELKGGDPVEYQLAKAKLNSLYGMCVQKPVKPEISENYDTGKYTTQDEDLSDKYDKYVKRRNSVLPYQWGVWVTAYAFYNIFQLGKCCETWIYSDTDSCYGINWDDDKVKAYNNNCIRKLKDNGYGSVYYNMKEYWLGVAEFDGSYSEYRVLGAKRYCGRSTKDNELHITVAGVPKSGSKCLNDNIDNFTAGFIFNGAETGKKTHTYHFVNDIYTDSMGNISGDSVDLNPCDYLLDNVFSTDLERFLEEEIEVRVYE